MEIADQVKEYKPEDDATENVSPEEESENVDQ